MQKSVILVQPMGKNNLIYLAVAAVVLIGLFYIFKPKTSSAPTTGTSQPTQSEPSTPASTSAQPANEKVFNLTVQNKKLTGIDTLQANQGDEVTFNITSDVSEEFHLHGYDKHVDLVKGQTVQMKFMTDKSGRFPFELEDDKVELGALEVQPKQ